MIPKRIKEPIVRFKKKCFNPKSTFAGLTLREWAILNSILFFIMTTLLLTCAVLATVHRKNVLQLIQSDIEMEQERIISEMESRKHLNGLKHLSDNELKLQRSEEYVAMSQRWLDLFFWLSWANTCFAALSFVGVCRRNANFIWPFLLVSQVTYILIVTFQTFTIMGLIPQFYRYPSQILEITFLASPILLIMYTILTLYYFALRIAMNKKKKGIFKETIIKSNGNYLHKVQTTDAKSKDLVTI